MVKRPFCWLLLSENFPQVAVLEGCGGSWLNYFLEINKNQFLVTHLVIRVRLHDRSLLPLLSLVNLIVRPFLHEKNHGVPIPATSVRRFGKFPVSLVEILFMLLPLATHTAPRHLGGNRLTIVTAVPGSKIRVLVTFWHLILCYTFWHSYQQIFYTRAIKNFPCLQKL